MTIQAIVVGYLIAAIAAMSLYLVCCAINPRDDEGQP